MLLFFPVAGEGAILSGVFLVLPSNAQYVEGSFYIKLHPLETFSN